LQVRISPVIPASFAESTSWSASKAVGLNTDGDSSPKPHSLSGEGVRREVQEPVKLPPVLAELARRWQRKV
jgi:hypothetical protein